MPSNDPYSERPPDSDFQQQNLKAWQPLLTPTWVIGTFFTIGALFIPVGYQVLDASAGVRQFEVSYFDIPCNTTLSPTAKATDVTNCKKVVNLEIEDDIGGEGQNIYFYYKLTNFYQNHRRYVKSRNDKQLRGEEVAPGSLTSCNPLISKTVKENGTDVTKTLYPCGLIANSYFNDDFMVETPVIVRGNEKIPFNMTAKGIAWPSDLEKFKNLASFDPKTMVRAPNVPDVTDEAFIVWMRTAGLPSFKKLRYIIKNTAFKKGDRLQLIVHDQFEVTEFAGEKSILISTTSWLGGKNTFLGYAYLIVGSLCLLFALLFLIKHKLSPRELGDMKYFNWETQKTDKN
jgi:hypothetical protein